MNTPINQRNTLGPAYTAAEGLYDNAVALSLFLDAWSRRFVTPEFNPQAVDHLHHNLINAQSNLSALRQALADALDTTIPPSGDKPWPANDDCAADAVGAKSSTAAGMLLGPRSVRSDISGTGI